MTQVYREDYGKNVPASGVDMHKLIAGVIFDIETSIYEPEIPYMYCHPIYDHWFKFSSYFGTTNSKRKFRHRNYDKACKNKRRNK
jgi:hypothetical protein